MFCLRLSLLCLTFGVLILYILRDLCLCLISGFGLFLTSLCGFGYCGLVVDLLGLLVYWLFVLDLFYIA